MIKTRDAAIIESERHNNHYKAYGSSSPLSKSRKGVLLL